MDIAHQAVTNIAVVKENAMDAKAHVVVKAFCSHNAT